MFILAFAIETIPFIRWYLKNKDEQVHENHSTHENDHINKSEFDHSQMKKEIPKEKSFNQQIIMHIADCGL